MFNQTGFGFGQAGSSQLIAGRAFVGTANVLGTVSAQLIGGSALIGTHNVLGTVSAQLIAGSAFTGTGNVLGTVSAQLIGGVAFVGTIRAIGVVSSQLIAGIAMAGTVNNIQIAAMAGQVIDTASNIRLVSTGSVNLLANTTGQLVVALGALLRTCVVQVFVSSESTNMVTFLAGANTITATFPVGSRTPMLMDYCQHAWFKTSQNTILNVTQTQSANTAVHVVYYPGI